MARRERTPDRNPGSGQAASDGNTGTERPKKRRGLGNRKNTAADDAADAARRTLRSRVFDLRCLGVTYERIAAELGISVSSAHDYYRVACSEYGKESSEQHKAKANARFDGQLVTLRNAEAALRAKASGRRREDGSWEAEPDLDASSVLTSNLRAQAYIVKEQARMNGSYAPDKVEHTGAGGGPIAVALDDVLGAMRENEAGVDAERPERVTH